MKGSAKPEIGQLVARLRSDKAASSNIRNKIHEAWRKEVLDMLDTSILAAQLAGMSDQEIIAEVNRTLKHPPKKRRVRIRSGSSGT